MVGIEGTNSNKCLYGDPTGERTLILFGDSHAMQYFPAVEELAENHDWRLIVLTKAECPPERSRRSGAWSKTASTPSATNGARKPSSGSKRAARGDRGDERRHRIHALRPGRRRTDRRRGRAKRWKRATCETLERIEAAGLHTVVIRDNPASLEDVPSCVSEDIQHLGRCAFPGRHEWDREYDVRAAEASPETHLIDFIGDICPGEVCRAVIGNALVYRDKDHLTATFARTLEPMLEKRDSAKPAPVDSAEASRRQLDAARLRSAEPDGSAAFVARLGNGSRSEPFPGRSLRLRR